MKDRSLEDIYLDQIWENGSSLEKSYLAHHGILGMKWGIRRFQNKDGTLTEEGKARYRKEAKRNEEAVRKLCENSAYNEDISDKVFNMLHLNKEYKKQAEKVLDENLNTQKDITNQADELFKGLRSEENLHVYEAASEMAYDAVFYNRDVGDCTIGELGSSGFMGVLEDGQQGPINAYSMYAYKNNIEGKVKDLATASNDAERNARSEAKDIFTEALKEVGAENFAAYSKNPNYTVASAMASQLRNSKRYGDWKATNGSWYLNQAANAEYFSDRDKTNVDEAEKYVRKIKGCEDENTWRHVTEAVENLGLDRVKLKYLSQSDWDKINREIAKLKDEG